VIVRLPANRPADRFYRGGERISRFRGEDPAGAREPEDWIGSVSTVFGEAELGLTRLPDGRFLRDAVTSDPVFWLGGDHVERWGDDTRLLVKLLDAGERLPVHAHPHDDFAARHLGLRHGKAEAWYILEGGTVHIGLRRDVTEAELVALVDGQDVDTLLALLNEVDVSPGDVVWVPPGELHAIGAGVFLLEVQQPEDLSILLEWDGFALDGARDGHLGLGFGVALGAVSHAAVSDEALAERVRAAPTSGSVFPAAADEYFRLDRHPVHGRTVLEAGFSIVVVTAGQLDVGRVPAAAGSTLLVPAAHGSIDITGDGELLVARPPRP
jgi:mannose-6-phosphate isomerase